MNKLINSNLFIVLKEFVLFGEVDIYIYISPSPFISFRYFLITNRIALCNQSELADLDEIFTRLVRED